MVQEEIAERHTHTRSVSGSVGSFNLRYDQNLRSLSGVEPGYLCPPCWLALQLLSDTGHRQYNRVWSRARMSSARMATCPNATARKDACPNVSCARKVTCPNVSCARKATCPNVSCARKVTCPNVPECGLNLHVMKRANKLCNRIAQ